MGTVIRLVGLFFASFGLFGILGTLPNLLGTNSPDIINPFAILGLNQPTFDIPLVDMIVWTVLLLGGGFMLLYRKKRK